MLYVNFRENGKPTMSKWKPGKLAWLKSKWKLPSMAGAYPAFSRLEGGKGTLFSLGFGNPMKNRIIWTGKAEAGRHQTHEKTLSWGVKEAVRSAGVVKHVSCHTLRHSFVKHICLKQAMTPYHPRTLWAQGCQNDHDACSCLGQRRPWGTQSDGSAIVRFIR